MDKKGKEKHGRKKLFPHRGIDGGLDDLDGCIDRGLDGGLDSGLDGGLNRCLDGGLVGGLDGDVYGGLCGGLDGALVVALGHTWCWP